MATRTAVHIADEDVQVKRVQWTGLTSATSDVGSAVKFGSWKDRTVQVTGTFGAGGSVSLKGSNDGGTTWATLTDANNAALTFTSTGLKAITELPYEIRPEVTAGDGTTSLTVTVAMQGRQG